MIERITKLVKELSNSIKLDKEPVLCIFNYKGLTCVVTRNFTLNYCGYVEKLYDVDIDSIKVHGGITFYDSQLGHISEELGNKVFIGFDTCHAGDILIGGIHHLVTHGKYRSFRYAMKETMNLADQIYMCRPSQKPLKP